MKFTVTFGIDADNTDEAQELIGTWTVTPGTTLFSIVPIPEALPPSIVDAGGSVATAIARSKTAATPPPPVMPLPPPPGPPASLELEDPDG